MASKFRDYKERRKITMDEMLGGFALDSTQMESVIAAINVHKPKLIENIDGLPAQPEISYCFGCKREVPLEGCYTWHVVRPSILASYNLPVEVQES